MVSPFNQSVRAFDRVASPGQDASAMPPVLLTTLLTSFEVNQPGEYVVQNQSAAAVQVVFDDGNDGIPSVYLLAAGATIEPIPWFVGRVQVFGAAAAAIFARHN